MPSAFAKPENVLTLAGIALADLAVLVSAQQYVPTLHMSKTSWWNGTRINQIRFGSYPETGLIELARSEAAARAGTWDAWAFGCIAVSPADQTKLVLLVQAGDAPVASTVHVVQEFRLPTDGFGLLGDPHLSLTYQAQSLPLDEADLSRWPNLLHQGMFKLKTVRDNWQQWNASPTGQAKGSG